AELDAAIALARRSGHPSSRAIADLVGSGAQPAVDGFVESPGYGTEGWISGKRYRLGRPEWALDGGLEKPRPSGTVLSSNGGKVGCFTFSDVSRPQAAQAAAELAAAG